MLWGTKKPESNDTASPSVDAKVQPPVQFQQQQQQQQQKPPQPQGPILRNSVSAENFSDSFSNYRQIFTRENNLNKSINLSEYFAPEAWISRYFNAIFTSSLLQTKI
jgi:hypothetical protein